MKKAIKYLAMAALAMTIGACSSEDSELAQQPVENNGMITIPGKLAPKTALTRALSKDVDNDSKNIIVAKWVEGETLAVVFLSGDSKREMGKATITAVDNTGAATFVCNVENGTNITNNPECDIIYPYKAAYDGATGVKTYPDFLGLQDGTLSNNLDVRVGKGVISDIAGGTGEATATLTVTQQPEPQYAIFKFTLTSNSSNIQASVFTVKGDGGLITTVLPTSMYELYVALPPDTKGGSNYTFMVSDGLKTYTKTMNNSASAIEKGVYYETPLEMGAGVDCKVELANLSIEDGGTYTVKDYDVLTGTLNKNVKISIPAGATVVLNNATINGTNDVSYAWAGLTCEGNATIILKGTTNSSVKGFYENWPGIYVPSGKTLTIKGTDYDFLSASSNGLGAGIGGGFNIDGGNIVIEGGQITATGGSRGAAGIGGGVSADCGNITITGGIIDATGGAGAVGIGSGSSSDNSSDCGKITIANTVSRVTAKTDATQPATYLLGASNGGSCGTITIGGTVRAQTDFNTEQTAGHEYNYLP